MVVTPDARAPDRADMEPTSSAHSHEWLFVGGGAGLSFRLQHCCRRARHWGRGYQELKDGTLFTILVTHFGPSKELSGRHRKQIKQFLFGQVVDGTCCL